MSGFLTQTQASVTHAKGLGDVGDGTFTIDLSNSPFLPGSTTQWSNPCDPTLGPLTAACAAMAPQVNTSNWIGASPQEQVQALQDLSTLTNNVLNPPPDYTPWIIGAAFGVFALFVFAGGHH